MTIRRILFAALFTSIFLSCLTYYEKNLLFHEYFATGNYEKAESALDKNKFIQKQRNHILYLLDKGITVQMMGDFTGSNSYFEEAYIYFEDFERNYGQEALALVTNDMVRRYAGEDFEKVFIHYYKAINYILMNQPDEALVECRRINIRLNEINDKYKSQSKYKRDAFAHNLMGLFYDATGDVNNAFIAYRNAYEIYEEDYKKFFNLGPPQQLKKDLIRTANLNGFFDEEQRYEKIFNIKFDREKDISKRELVYIWHNGLGPVKDEWSINFVIIRGQGGYVAFVNKELGLNFGFYTRSQDEYASLGDLKVIRVAFPKYTVRKKVFSNASVSIGRKEYRMEEVEDIDQIAVKSLEDRMLRELSKTLLRTALKQASEAAVRKNNQDLGAVVSVFNAITEKADTRNWQTLPSSIYYTRIPVDADTVDAVLNIYRGGEKVRERNFRVGVGNGIRFVFSQSISKESLL